VQPVNIKRRKTWKSSQQLKNVIAVAKTGNKNIKIPVPRFKQFLSLIFLLVSVAFTLCWSIIKLPVTEACLKFFFFRREAFKDRTPASQKITFLPKLSKKSKNFYGFVLAWKQLIFLVLQKFWSVPTLSQLQNYSNDFPSGNKCRVRRIFVESSRELQVTLNDHAITNGRVLPKGMSAHLSTKEWGRLLNFIADKNVGLRMLEFLVLGLQYLLSGSH